MPKAPNSNDDQAMVEILLPIALHAKEKNYANLILKHENDPKKAQEVMSSCFREHRLDTIMWLAQNGVEIPLELADAQLHNATEQPELSSDGIPPLSAQDLL
jgi:hypothetical protein